MTDLQPSKLGTKEHWDNVYEEELTNFEEIGDEGEVWFGSDSVEKMVTWVEELRASLREGSPSSYSDPYVLEVGSGNGSLLFALVEAGYPATRLSGIDYSEGAVQLAKAVAPNYNSQDVTFNMSDFLDDEPPLLDPQKQGDPSRNAWGLILDKGTFDAMALMEKREGGTAPVDEYPKHVARLLKPGGHFLITSCNFTEDELRAKFITPETGLEYHSRVQHPTFSFGGKSGSIVSSIALKKP